MDITKVTRALNKVALKVYEHRADIAFFSGMGLTAVGTGLFIKKTFKQAEIVEDHKARKKEAEVGGYSEEEKKNLLKENNRLTLKKTIKNYAVPVVISAAGYGLEVYGHQSVKSDLSAASAALSSVTAAYELVKQRVIESEGEDKWQEYANGVRVKDDVLIDVETGIAESDHSIEYGQTEGLYSILFYEPNPNFNSAKGVNKAYLLQMEKVLNDKLRRKGVVFYHEVLEALGYEMTIDAKEATCKAGWMYEDENGATNYIDFGLRAQDEATIRFWNEQEAAVMLKFNCVTNVYKYL